MNFSPPRVLSDAISFLILVALTSGVPQAFSQEPDAIPEQGIRTEVGQRWNEYRRFARNLEGTFSTRITDPSSNRVSREARGAIKQLNHCILFEYESIIPARETSEVLARNTKYSFRLVHRADKREWVLVECARNDDVVAASPLNTLDLAASLWTCPEFCALHTRFLPDLLVAPDFVVKRAEPIDQFGQRLVRLEYAYRPRDPSELTVEDGFMILDPEAHWAVKRYEMRYRNRSGTGIQSLDNRYTVQGGFPVATEQLIHVVANKFGKAAPDIRDERNQFDLVQNDHLTEKDFTLSAYGMPEPEWLDGAQSRPYLWLGLGGGVCLVLGLAFHRIAQRKKMAYLTSS
jgi:hypothetical protein